MRLFPALQHLTKSLCREAEKERRLGAMATVSFEAAHLFGDGETPGPIATPGSGNVMGHEVRGDDVEVLGARHSRTFVLLILRVRIERFAGTAYQ